MLPDRSEASEGGQSVKRVSKTGFILSWCIITGIISVVGLWAVSNVFEVSSYFRLHDGP
jgi:hypothetical protein